MRVWKFNQRDFVAAERVQDATSWYNQHVGVVEGSHTIEECSLDTVMKVEVNEVENRLVSFGERLEQMSNAGKSFRAFVAFDTGYGDADRTTLAVIRRARGK